MLLDEIEMHIHKHLLSDFSNVDEEICEWIKHNSL